MPTHRPVSDYVDDWNSAQNRLRTIARLQRLLLGSRRYEVQRVYPLQEELDTGVRPRAPRIRQVRRQERVERALLRLQDTARRDRRRAHRNADYNFAWTNRVLMRRLGYIPRYSQR